VLIPALPILSGRKDEMKMDAFVTSSDHRKRFFILNNCHSELARLASQSKQVSESFKTLWKMLKQVQKDILLGIKTFTI